MRSIRALFALFLLFFIPCIALAQVPIPALKSHITDTTGTLSPHDRERLDAELEALQRTKGAQIVVLIVPTTGGETIEEFALRVAETWQIGRVGTDDGIVFVVAKNDRRMRIEVGYGLEGVVPDAVANRIMDELVTPEFRAGNFTNGIQNGVQALTALVRGEPLPAPPAGGQGPGAGLSGDSWLVLLFLALAIGRSLRSMFGPGFGALLTGGGVGLFASFFSPLIVAIFLGIFAGIFVLMAGDGLALSPYGRRTYTGYGGFPRGGGGLRGGGGRFGGGGASGSW